MIPENYSVDEYRLMGKITGIPPFKESSSTGLENGVVKLPRIIKTGEKRLPSIAPLWSRSSEAGSALRKMNARFSLGIDLGTSNSAVAADNFESDEASIVEITRFCDRIKSGELDSALRALPSTSR